MHPGKYYDIAQILNIEWLRKNRYCLSVPGEKLQWRTFHIAKALARQVPELERKDLVALLQTIIPSINERTAYRWIKCNWKFEVMYNQMYKRYAAALPNSEVEPFEVNVHTRRAKDLLGKCIICMQQLDCVVIRDTAPPEEPEEKPTAPLLPTTDITKIETMEDIVVEVCKHFATGFGTILQSCDKFGITYLQFIETTTTNHRCAEVYREAVRIANMLQNSRQLTLADQRMLELLERGHHLTENIHYQKKIIPGQLQAKWIERSKTVTKRDFNPSELLMLKIALVKGVVINLPGAADEISTMSDAELLRFNKENEAKINAMINEAATKLEKKAD